MFASKAFWRINYNTLIHLPEFCLSFYHISQTKIYIISILQAQQSQELTNQLQKVN